MLDRKLKRRLNGLFRLVIMLAICIITVYLFPKAGSFQYEYHKGMQWRYETLNAPFDFPIYKTEDELQNEREKIMEKQSPIFFLNPETAPQHIQRFQSALHQFSQEATPAALQKVLDKIQTIYQAGIVQLPEQYNADKIHQLKIVENNIGRKVDFNRIYTLKKAYSTLSEQIKQAGLPKSVQDRILSLNLNNFLQPNLEFDESKTTLELFNQLQHISLTEGMVQQGDVIISQSETVTPEKIKILNSLKNEYQLKLGTTETYMKTIGGQVILVLASLLIFSIFFYYSKKRIFYNNREFIFLYGLFQATILLGSLGYYQNINIFAVPVLFFIIIVNILIGSRSALYLLLSTTLLLAYYAPNSYMFAFMQIAAGIVSIFSLIHLQRRGQLILSIFFIFIT